MTGKKIGYIRVSTILQNTVRQLDGLALDKVFTDKCSGKDTKRPQLQLCLEFTREGDTLIVHSMDRLARDLGDLRDTIDEQTDKGVHVQFIKENLTFTGKDSLMANLMLNIMGAVAEFELGKIAERRDEGILTAKRCQVCNKPRSDHAGANHKFQNKYAGRAPAIRASNGKLETLKKLIAEEATPTEMARELGVSRQTVYSMLKNLQTEEVAA